MKFLSMKVENFMALAEAEVELSDRGLVLIQGINTDDSSASSNGAGKSTLMNSLMWCIYGETAHGVKGDDVLSTGNEKNCRVQVTIEDEGKKFAIIRHRNHKEFKNRLIVRGEDGDMTKGKDTLTQELVERLIGASKEVFTASIYASQEAMPDLPGMTDKNLKAIVEEAAGVDRLTRAYSIARERANAAAARVDNVKTKMEGTLSLVDSAETELKSAKASSEEWEKSRSQRLEKSREDLTGAEVELAEAELELRTIPEQIRDKQNAITAEREKLATKDEHDKKLVRVRAVISEAEGNIRSAETLKASAVKRAHNNKAQADAIDSKVGTPCPTCGKAYCSEDLSTVKENYIGQARSEIAEAQASAATVAEQQGRLDKARGIERALIDATPDVSAIVARIQQLNGELSTLNKRSGDKFNINVSKAGSSKSFMGLSGGEKRKVRISCSLALQDLVASRASKNIQLFIGDEIDDALDSAGLERLMGILETKARERGTVMIISHKEMKSWFRETITVEVKDGRSYVS